MILPIRKDVRWSYGYSICRTVGRSTVHFPIGYAPKRQKSAFAAIFPGDWQIRKTGKKLRKSAEPVMTTRDAACQLIQSSCLDIAKALQYEARAADVKGKSLHWKQDIISCRHRLDHCCMCCACVLFVRSTISNTVCALLVGYNAQCWSSTRIREAPASLWWVSETVQCVVLQNKTQLHLAFLACIRSYSLQAINACAFIQKCM